jgi:molybdopterin synthase sulfur carrier subunit
MLDVLLFASIRERLGVDRLRAAPAADVDTLIDRLAAERGAIWADALRAPNVVVAVNQIVVESGQALHDGDEVAFFPPVTGG